jgi:hypothetical protein
MDLRRLEEMDTATPAKGAAAHYYKDALKDASVAEMDDGTD